jgi:hypothetical protein
MNPYLRLFRAANGHLYEADVYDVCAAFETWRLERQAAPVDHAIKKLLCCGIRGHKSRKQDLIEAKIAIERAIEMEGE